MEDYKPVIIGIVVTLTVGLISIFTTIFGFFVQILLGTIAIIVGGLVAAYTTEGDYKDGGINGVLCGICGGALLGGLMVISYHYTEILEILAGMVVGGIMFGFNFGIIGAVVGNEIKNYPLKTGKDNGYLVCNKCGGIYDLQEAESPEDFSDECECGGKIEFKKSIKPKIKISFDRVFVVGIIFCLTGIIMVFSVNGEEYLLHDFINSLMLKVGLLLLLFGILVMCVPLLESWGQ